MRLRDLADDEFRTLKEQLGGEVGDLAITGLSADSRKIAPGMLFVAVAGTKADGAAYAADAVARGAAAVVAGHAVEASVPVFTVANPRRFLALAAARF
ncbi:MAG TPA: Mur ligase domain-containing protein, partial [Rhizobium sp.]|nr:Mur ligase domain-containing protein [Rhizobium sp.]